MPRSTLRITTLSAGALLVALPLLFGGAQTPPATPAAQSAQTQPPTPPASRPVRTRAELERDLATLLTNVVLEGTSQTARGEAPPGPPQPDRYRIASAAKAEDDWWVIHARLQYGENELTLPVRLRVVWAEQTPILTLDKTTLPGLGTYSAQVMITDGWYSGVWSGTGYGGVLSGRITSEPPAPASAPADGAAR